MTRQALAWCREQPWWDRIQPLTAQGCAVALHVPVGTIPDAIITPLRRSVFVRAFALRVKSSRPGLLVVRECPDNLDAVHFEGRLLDGTEDFDVLVDTYVDDDVQVRASLSSGGDAKWDN